MPDHIFRNNSNNKASDDKIKEYIVEDSKNQKNLDDGSKPNQSYY